MCVSPACVSVCVCVCARYCSLALARSATQAPPFIQETPPCLLHTCKAHGVLSPWEGEALASSRGKMQCGNGRTAGALNPY